MASSSNPLNSQGLPRIPLKGFFQYLEEWHALVCCLEANLFTATTFPVKLCTSFTVFGDLTSIIAFTLSEFASIPHWDTMNPKNFLEAIAKTHLAGFNFILYLRSVLKVSLRSSKWLALSLLFTNISSTYTSTFLPICERACGSPVSNRWLLCSSVQRA